MTDVDYTSELPPSALGIKTSSVLSSSPLRSTIPDKIAAFVARRTAQSSPTKAQAQWPPSKKVLQVNVLPSEDLDPAVALALSPPAILSAPILKSPRRSRFGP